MFKEHVSLQSFLRQPKYMTKRLHIKNKKDETIQNFKSGDFSASIAGVYTGKLKVGTNVTADAYVVTVTKVSSSVVKVTADFYTDNGSENYNVTKEGNQYILSSESSSGINITVTGKAMTISFLNNAGSMTTFTGTRD